MTGAIGVRRRCLLVAGCLVTCAHAQTTVPACAVRAVEEHARIITGTITKVRLGDSDAPLGSSRSLASATISIERYIRGPQLPTESISLPVDWTDGSSRPWNLRKPLWYDVKVKPGERLLLAMLSAEEMGSPRDVYEFIPICVVEYDAYSVSIPTIERMVRLESAAGSAKVEQMKEALSDSTPAVRAIAINYLTNPSSRDPAVRGYVFHHFAPIALNPRNNDRRQAFYAITEAYDAFAGGTDLNYKILSFIAERMADPDPTMRDSAMQCMYGHLFGGGTDKPDPRKIWLVNRTRVLQQLRNDSSSSLYSHGLEKEALKLMEVFSRSD